MNDFYSDSGVPATGATGSSSTIRAEFQLIEAAFDKMPTLTGNGGKVIAVNSGATALEAVAGTTGSGNFVRATSPTLVTPALGTPASGTLTNCTGLPVSTGISGLGSGVATFLATPSSANLAAALSDEGTFTEVDGGVGFTNSWVNYGAPYETAGYLKDGFGFVNLKGLVKDGSTAAAMFTLPAGFRPANDHLFAVHSGPETVAEVWVRSSGAVFMNSGVTSALSLTGIRFKAA
jgi:hypothetical protein